MHLDVLHSISELALPLKHYDSSIFPDDSAWYQRFESYISHSPDQRRLAYARSTDGRDEVLMPLQLRIRSSSFSVLESLDNYYSVDYRPICSTASATALIGPLLEKVLRSEAPRMLWLRAMDPAGPETQAIFSVLREQRWTAYSSVQQINWIHQLTGNYDDYLESRSGRVRNTLRRKSAKLMALPGVSLTVHQGVNDLENALQAYNEIYDKSWKVPEPHTDFVPQLIRAMAEQGQLRLGILRVHDTPIAAHFWIVKWQIAYIYKLAHDKTYDSFSPGTVLLGKMIEHTMEHDQINRLDFLSGDDPYKSDWMSERREKIQIRAYNPHSPIAQFARYRDEYVKPFVRRFKLQHLNVSAGMKNS